MTPSSLLILCLAIPLVGSAGIALCARVPNLREAMTLISAVALFGTMLALVPALESSTTVRVVIASTIPGLDLALALEPLGLVFGLLSSFLWIVTSIYSIGYMRAHDESHQTRFYVCFAIALASTMGVALAENMMTLFVFYEALTLSTYPLVTHTGTPQARRAGRIYLGTLLGTSIGLQLVAIIWTWSVAGTLDFTPGGILTGKVSTGAATALCALYVFGVGKAALMPLHRWLPSAMVAPTPVSALLHAVAVVKAGVFTILKICVYIFGLDLLADDGLRDLPMYAAGATIIIASVIAMRQDNLKARLAYSTISQLSYVVVGALLANDLAAIGSGMHIFMHAFAKVTLFFCAGAIMVAAHKTEVSQLDGLGAVMPFTMLAFFVASLSVIGLPPVGGVWSKWFLALGTLEAGEFMLLAVLLASSLLNVAYLLPIPIRAFFFTARSQGDGSGPARVGIREAPWPCLIAIGITCTGCVWLFASPDWLYDMMLRAVER